MIPGLELGGRRRDLRDEETQTPGAEFWNRGVSARVEEVNIRHPRSETTLISTASGVRVSSWDPNGGTFTHLGNSVTFAEDVPTFPTEVPSS